MYRRPFKFDVDTCELDLERYRRTFSWDGRDKKKSRDFLHVTRGSVGIKESTLRNWRTVRRREREVSFLAASLNVRRWSFLKAEYVRVFGEGAARKRNGSWNHDRYLVLLDQRNKEHGWEFDGHSMTTTSVRRLVERACQDTNIKYHTLSESLANEVHALDNRVRRLRMRAHDLHAIWVSSLAHLLETCVDEMVASDPEYGDIDRHDAVRIFTQNRVFLFDDGREKFGIQYDRDRGLVELDIADGCVK